MTLFQEKAQEYFSFLVDEFGFHAHETDDYKVVWNKEPYHISICYDAHRSYELDMGYGYYGSDDIDDSQAHGCPHYDLYEILQYADIKYDSFLCQASNAESLSTLLKKMAELLHVACRKVDLFVPETFDSLCEIRTKNCSIYERHNLTKQGNHFWESKNYSSLIQLYEIHAEILTPLEKQRLDYAQKKCCPCACPEVMKNVKNTEFGNDDERN
jgi:hypothetical protein